MKASTPKKFPRRLFWRNIRFFLFFTLLGVALNLFLTQYAKAFIPDSVSIYLVYGVLGMILFVVMMLLSLKVIKPYRKLLTQVENLPLDIPQAEKLKAIYIDQDLKSLDTYLISHQETVQKRVNNIDDENQKLASLIHSFPFPMIAINKNKEVHFYNTYASELFPKLRDESSAQNLFDEDILLKLNESLLQNIKSTLSYKKIQTARAKLLFRIELTPVRAPHTSDISGVLLVFISSDNAMAAQRISDDLLKGISLNLITPIRQLQEFDLPPEAAHSLENAKLRAESFHELFEMNSQNWESLKPFNLKVAFAELIDLYKGRYPDKKVTIDDSLLKLVHMNVYPELFQTALKNIISNCFKYSRSEISIRIKSFIEDDNIFVEISDNGKGISKEQLEGIFEYFYQQALLGQSAPDGKLRLGLSIIKSAIFHHGGRVNIYSKEGSGTTIRIKLPYHCKA